MLGFCITVTSAALFRASGGEALRFIEIVKSVGAARVSLPCQRRRAVANKLRDDVNISDEMRLIAEVESEQHVRSRRAGEQMKASAAGDGGVGRAR